MPVPKEKPEERNFFMERSTKKIKQCNLLCALLILGLLVCQFLPFWNGVSIQKYVWFPSDNEAVGGIISEATGREFSVNDVVLMPVLVLLSGAVGIVLCLWKPEEIFSSIAGIICAVSGIWGYLAEPAFRLGSLWVLHFILCLLILAVSAMTAFCRINGFFTADRK